MEDQGHSNVILEEVYNAVDLSKRDLTNQVVRDSKTVHGKGASADVHRGTWNVPTQSTDRETGRVLSPWVPYTVAIKELRVFTKRYPSWYKIINKLFHEIGIWCWLNHPNIVPFYGYIIDLNERVGLVSQWCEFGNLTEYLEHRPDASREDLALDVAEGIAYLHSHSPPIVHADLKGANILVNQHGIACICDFGISIFVEDACVQTGFTTTSDLQGGSVRWTAPELLQEFQARKTFASDMYAFGGVLVEVFSGKMPYYYLKSDSLVIMAIMRGDPPLSEMYDISGEDNIFWNFALCLWKFEIAIRPSAQAIVNSLYASFRLHPRENENEARRPKAVVFDGSLFKFVDVVVEPPSVDAPGTSLSPDAKILCLRRIGTGSELLFYDLSNSIPEILWRVPFGESYGPYCGWDLSGSIVVYLTETIEGIVEAVLVNARNTTVHRQVLAPPLYFGFLKAARFTSSGQLAIALVFPNDVTCLHIYVLSDDLSAFRYLTSSVAKPPAEDRTGPGLALLAPHGAHLTIGTTAFDVLEPSGLHLRAKLSQNQTYFTTSRQIQTYITDLQVIRVKSEADSTLYQHLSYLLSINPLAPPENRYALSKGVLCIPHKWGSVSDSNNGWQVCMLDMRSLGIWHCSVPLPVATLDMQDVDGEVTLKLVVYRSVATIVILTRGRRLASIYRVPLPGVG